MNRLVYDADSKLNIGPVKENRIYYETIYTEINLEAQDNQILGIYLSLINSKHLLLMRVITP